MKSILFKSSLIFLLFISSSIFAQDFQGKVTYMSKTTLDIDFSASGIPADRVQMIKERMKNNLEGTYEFTFNKIETIDNALDNLIKEEKNALIKNCINKLPEDSSALLTLFYFEELSLEEISKIYQVNGSWATSNCI